MEFNQGTALKYGKMKEQYLLKKYFQGIHIGYLSERDEGFFTTKKITEAKVFKSKEEAKKVQENLLNGENFSIITQQAQP